MKIKLDPEALTFGDMEDFEEVSGSPLMEAFANVGKSGEMATLKAKDLVALVWICGRAEDPEFTLDQARRVRMSDIEVEVGTDADPTDGSA